MDIQEEIKRQVESNPEYIIGFADIRGFSQGSSSEYRYAISIGKEFDSTVIDKIKDGPTEEYYRYYKKTNEELEKTILKLSQFLSHKNVDNIPLQPSFKDSELDDDYFKTLRTPFSHKFAATRSGIGWIGKTDLLISKKYGPRLRLASILIKKSDHEFKVGTPITSSLCGSCTICVDTCPAQAANGKIWNTSTDRDEFYDAHKCRTKCRELSKLHINKEISLCGICVAACPIGKKKKSIKI